MQIIQTALSATGIPTYHDKWVPANKAEPPPEQYLVYKVYTYEDRHHDDQIVSLRHDIYISLYSNVDTSEAVQKVRAAMWGIAYSMREERTDADFDTRDFAVHWTWVGREVL